MSEFEYSKFQLQKDPSLSIPTAIIIPPSFPEQVIPNFSAQYFQFDHKPADLDQFGIFEGDTFEVTGLSFSDFNYLDWPIDVEIGVFYSKDEQVDLGSDILAYSGTINEFQSSGGGNTVWAQYESPLGAVGSYNVLVSVDYRNIYLETNETDNTQLLARDLFFEPRSLTSDLSTASAVALATAAYSLATGEDENINNENPLAEAIASELLGEVYEPVEFDLPGADPNAQFLEEGYYVNQNAAALVTRTADTLYISFRGTNDLSTPALFSKFFKKTIKLVDETIDLTPTAGNLGLAALKIQTKVLRKLNEPETPSEQLEDVKEWFDRLAHWEKFSDLMVGMESYLADNLNIKKVYVTGHSLGGSMVDAFMRDYQDYSLAARPDLTFSGMTFASPSLGNLSGNEGDTRYTNVLLQDDPIRVIENSSFTDNSGKAFVISTPGVKNFAAHSTETYINAINEIDGLAYDPDFIFQNFDSAFLGNDRSNSLLGFEDGEAAVFHGGKGRDTMRGNSDVADTFFFSAGDGKDTINNFEVGKDRFEFDGIFFDEVVVKDKFVVVQNVPISFARAKFGSGDRIDFVGISKEDIELYLASDLVQFEEPFLLA